MSLAEDFQKALDRRAADIAAIRPGETKQERQARISALFATAFADIFPDNPKETP